MGLIKIVEINISNRNGLEIINNTIAIPANSIIVSASVTRYVDGFRVRIFFNVKDGKVENIVTECLVMLENGQSTDSNQTIQEYSPNWEHLISGNYHDRKIRDPNSTHAWRRDYEEHLFPIIRSLHVFVEADKHKKIFPNKYIPRPGIRDLEIQ